MRKSIGGIVFNAATITDPEAKINYLRQNLGSTESLKLIRLWVDKNIHFLLPDGDIPQPIAEGTLSAEQLYSIVNGLVACTNIGALRYDKTKRETLFIKCCVGLLPDDLKLLEHIKDKTFIDGLSEKDLREAFPRIERMPF